MTTLILETEPLVIKVTVTDEKVIVDLADGRSPVCGTVPRRKDIIGSYLETVMPLNGLI
jgi:hypothetical protein